MIARYPSTCARCHDDIVVGEAIVLQHRGGYIHFRCASGQDDE